MLNPVHYNVPVDVTLVPEDVSQILYIYRNVIWAISRKNQSYLFRKTYACMAQRHEETFDFEVSMQQIGWCGYLHLLEHPALLLTSNGTL